MGDDRGGFAPATSRCPTAVAALHDRRANVVQREATEGPSRAPYHRGSEPRLIGAGNPRPGQGCRGASLEDVYYSRQLARNQTGKVKEWCCLCDLPCCEGLKAARDW